MEIRLIAIQNVLSITLIEKLFFEVQIIKAPFDSFHDPFYVMENTTSVPKCVAIII